MLEESLQEIEFKTLLSLPSEIKSKYLENIYKLHISIDSAFNIIKAIYKENSAISVFGWDIDILLEDFKYILMIYSCYFAMDYINNKKNPNGIQLTAKFIRRFYDCNSNIQKEIMNNIKDNKKDS